MNDRSRLPPLARPLFEGLAHTPQQHFTLYFYAALLRVTAQASLHFGSAEAANERFPFLAGYLDEMAACGLAGVSFGDAHVHWRDAIDAWERAAHCRLPLAALRAAAASTHDDLTLLAEIGLPDEDPRFGLVFDAMQGGAGEGRPTPAVLAAGWQDDAATDARSAAHRLRGARARSERPSVGARDCVRSQQCGRRSAVGDCSAGGWARHRACDALPALAALALPACLARGVRQAAAALASGAAAATILRGPAAQRPRQRSRPRLRARWARGRSRSPVCRRARPAVARRGDARVPARCASSSAAAIPGPSESFELPDLCPMRLAPLFVTLGRPAVSPGALADRAITLRVPVPDREARERLWRDALGEPLRR